MCVYKDVYYTIYICGYACVNIFIYIYMPVYAHTHGEIKKYGKIGYFLNFLIMSVCI